MSSMIEMAQKMIRNSADGLAKNLQAMPADKATWKPMDVGRTALDQVIECAGFSFLAAKSLTARANPVMDPGAMETLRAEIDTPEKAVTLLQQGTETLLAAIAAFPPEMLTDTIAMPWGMETTFGEMLLIVNWNHTYHIGQLAYIQTLYGDKEMH